MPSHSLPLHRPLSPVFLEAPSIDNAQSACLSVTKRQAVAEGNAVSRRWTGIEPAVAGILRPTALKAARPTRCLDTSVVNVDGWAGWPQPLHVSSWPQASV